MSAGNTGRIALLWEESFLWGIMATRALNKIRIPFDLVTAREVVRGALDHYEVLFVPGGWAGDKSRALGVEGRRKIDHFVRTGGRFIGFCGGAGLALDVQEGLSLVPVRRMPTTDRIPNFSGKIGVSPADEKHPLWRGMTAPHSFYAWWPGQFLLDRESSDGVHVVACYGKPESDFFVADLKADDLAAASQEWEEWEAFYGIRMHPDRLIGEPAMLEGACGRGKVFLSYLHLDTPDDPAGLQALQNLFRKWSRLPEGAERRKAEAVVDAGWVRVHQEALELFDSLEREGEALIDLGRRNYLWFWRKPYLLQWRRGIRGMEYGIVLMMIRELRRRFYRLRSSGRMFRISDGMEIEAEVDRLRPLAENFFHQASRLLLLERFALNRGVQLHHLRTDDPEIGRLRELLFSKKRRFGGLFKEFLDRLDGLLLAAMRSEG